MILACRVEFLCHDINVHVPHHVNSKIPWYNLRAATDSLRQNWGQVSPQAPIYVYVVRPHGRFGCCCWLYCGSVLLVLKPRL